jgi:hypothetical protein
LISDVRLGLYYENNSQRPITKYSFPDRFGSYGAFEVLLQTRHRLNRITGIISDDKDKGDAENRILFRSKNRAVWKENAAQRREPLHDLRR